MLNDDMWHKQPCGHTGVLSIYVDKNGNGQCTACANEMRRNEFQKDHPPPPRRTLLDRILLFFHYLGQ